ncbi:Exostosin domain-containing protein [Cephalotus follicularis]|uniref:Exostosin domain-containing protein n=1 Tax=Cephalotus follicularis TaxID=3775 RepID=A0A1Q3ATH4_CEPFO|nr:Exostosin domain-containing protein [Cephalotus follicularis]
MIMEKPVTAKLCNYQLWFTFLSSFILCFIILCFDYSALLSSSSGATYVNNMYSNSITGQEPKSHDFTRNSTNPFLNLSNSITEHPLKESETDSCLGRYIYTHDLPTRFNEDLLKNCQKLTRGTDKNMCPYLVNNGLGHLIEDSEMVLLNNSWFSTNQFMLEVIFHEKMKKYECLTYDPSLASAIYVPFYAGLDMSLYLWGYNISVRDSSSLDLVKWLADKPEWRTMSGRDHFLVVGRIAWDFRRQTDNETDWGSKLRFLPESKNMSMLSIESSSWNNDFAIPYPTCFHPSKDSEVFQWQDQMRKQKRLYLFSFAGAPRSEYQNSVRGKIIEECLASKYACKLLDCNYGSTNCDNPVNVMKVFQSSVFCLQPPGDSYTRRSIFDAILAGCIPVFFHPGTAYAQYLWHLPKNFTTYSVYIPVRYVKNWNASSVTRTLLQIPGDKVLALQEEVIKLIPSIVYADPRSKLETLEDAYDLAVKGMLKKIETIRSFIREGKDPGISFADRDDYKYTFSPYEGKA